MAPTSRIRWHGLVVVMGSVLAVLAGPPLRAADDVDVTGVWSREGRFARTELTLAADGTCQRVTVRNEKQTRQVGRYTLRGDALEIRTTGGQVARYTVKRAGDKLRLTDDSGVLTLDRAGPAPATVGKVQAPVEPVVKAGDKPLMPRSAIERSATGHILYSRWLTDSTAPRRAIYLMDGQGRKHVPFVVPPAPWDAFEPTWSADGTKIAFASNYELTRSALNADIFLVDLRTGVVRRMTGNEQAPPATEGKAKILVIPAGKVVDAKAMHNSLRVCWQGGGGKTIKPLGEKRKTLIEDVPANQTIWIKARSSGFVGCLKVLRTPGPGKTAKVDFNINEGMPLATSPSLTPDGRYAVVLWQHAYYDPDPREKPRIMHGSYNLLGLKVVMPGTGERFAHESGFDTIAVIDLAKGTPPISGWDPIQMSGQFAKHPRVSPDGRSVLFTMGHLPMESIAVCSLASLAAGRPQPKILAEGKLVPAQYHLGHSYPAWSPDGKRIAFCQSHCSMNMNFTSNLWVAHADGSGARQITRLQLNQAAAYPTWSPDGKRIAAQVITSRRQVLNPLDIAAGNVVSDIYSIAADGTDPRQLTNDGRSAEPAWGP
jgi:Tol biopolymer transport system component